MKTVKITTDNVISIVDVDFDNYRSIQKEIGCDLFEIVRTGILQKYFNEPIVMLVDEEGLCKGLPENSFGCVFYGTINHGHPIVGDILLGVRIGPDIVAPDDAAELKARLMGDFLFLIDKEED